MQHQMLQYINATHRGRRQWRPQNFGAVGKLSKHFRQKMQNLGWKKTSFVDSLEAKLKSGAPLISSVRDLQSSEGKFQLPATPTFFNTRCR